MSETEDEFTHFPENMMNFKFSSNILGWDMQFRQVFVKGNNEYRVYIMRFI